MVVVVGAGAKPLGDAPAALADTRHAALQKAKP
jgi:hypothetical protein